MSQRKSVLITGAGGIGHALAKEFHTQGLRVIATARRKSSMHELSSIGIETFELDVTDHDAIRALNRNLQELLGGTLDILINNAGIAYHGAFLDTPLEASRAVFEANIFGVLVMVQEFAPMLMQSASRAPRPSALANAISYIPFSSYLPSSLTGLEGGRGLIINIGSINGIIPAPLCLVYNASKAALAQISAGLRVELAPFGIKVIHTITGGVKTNVLKPNLPPSGSLYEPMRKTFETMDSVLKLEEHTDPDVYARSVVAEALKPNPRAWLWGGKFATMVWLAYTFGNQTVFDGPLSETFGFTQYTKERRLKEGKTD